ncbi:MAG: hypothetical protein R2883_03225 [Caldisericia bacterium]
MGTRAPTTTHIGVIPLHRYDCNGRLDYHDSLALDVNAQTSFYVFAEDWVIMSVDLLARTSIVMSQQRATLLIPTIHRQNKPTLHMEEIPCGVTNDTTFYL